MSDKIDIGVCEDLDGDDDFGFFRGHRIMRLRGEDYKEFTARVRKESAVYHRAPERIAELEASLAEARALLWAAWDNSIDIEHGEGCPGDDTCWCSVGEALGAALDAMTAEEGDVMHARAEEIAKDVAEEYDRAEAEGGE